MIIYSRFNCKQHCIESNASQQPVDHDPDRAVRRMNLLRFDEIWLTERLDLFKTYTLPSINSQTNQKFIWVGIAHPDSPPWFIKELQKISRMRLILAELDTGAKIPGEHVTINLDTDDALARDFIAKAHEIKFIGETVFLRGMRYRPFTDCWLSTRAENSHFNVIKHPKITVLDFSHGKGPLKKQVLDPRKPMWLEVIHDKNISNRIKVPRADTNLGVRAAVKYFDIHYEGIVKGQGKYGRNVNG